MPPLDVTTRFGEVFSATRRAIILEEIEVFLERESVIMGVLGNLVAAKCPVEPASAWQGYA